MKRSKWSVLWVTVGAIVVILITIAYVLGLSYRPAYGSSRSSNAYAETISTAPNGQKHVHLNLNIVVEVGTGPHADWLGYQTRTSPPHPGPIFNVPAGALVTVDIHNYDSRTALRNTFFTLVQGTVGGVEYVGGKKVKVMNPALTSHTFTIPQMGVTVPMEGVSDTAKPTQYEDMRFTFRATKKKGEYRWQCIVPCGSGLYGFGGPMQQLGYMDGWITVT
ncbi:MAG: hypothetical protein ACRDFS_04020 [Chloroflexota bacterium]